MFEIKCIVADKKVVEVLNLLDGHTLEPPVVIPIKVASVKAANGGTHTSQPESAVTLLRAFLPGHKRLSSAEIRQHCEANGYSKNGYSYALKKLLEEGLLKRTKEPRIYEVTY